MMKCRRYIELLMMVLCCWGLAACEDEIPMVEMPLVIAVPAEGFEARSPGDPGNLDEYPLPKYAQVFVCCTSTEVTGGSVETVVVKKLDLDANKWTKPAGSSLYRYDTQLSLKLPDNMTGGRVFALLSQQAVTLNTPQPKTKSEVEGLNFNLAQNAGLSLKDLYANPLNDKDALNNGTVVIEGNLIKANLCCYHVAAKVDFMWEVHPDKRADYAMTELKLTTNVPNVGYPFQPTTKNTGTGELVVMNEFTPANQWMGREVAYVLQPQRGTLYWSANYGHTGGPQSATSNPTTSVSDTFTAWYRINMRIGYPK